MNLLVEGTMRLVFCMVDVYMFYIFMDSLFKQKAGQSLRWMAIIVLLICLYIVNLCGNPWFNLLTIPLAFVIFVSVLFEISLKRTILFVAIYYIIFAGNKEMAFEMLIRFIVEKYPQTATALYANANLLIILLEYIFSLILMWFIVKHTKKISLEKENHGDWCLLVTPIASIMILFSYVYNEFPTKTSIQVLVCLGGFLLYLANAIIFVILANYTATMNQVKMAEMVMLKKDLDEVHFQNVERANHLYQKYMHDIHNYFYQIRNLAKKGENQRIVNIIDDVEGKIESQVTEIIYIQDSIVNALLVENQRKAQDFGVDFSVFVEDFMDTTFINDVDKISIFGNLLNNAMEAVIQCEEGKRKISIQLYMANDYMLYFEVKNTWNQKSKISAGKYLTTKRDEHNHGLGISIVQELALQYGGSLDIQEDGEWFITTLLLSRH